MLSIEATLRVGRFMFPALKSRKQNRLLEDPRVDPSANNNEAIGIASAYGHLAIVNRLLADPRVDPRRMIMTRLYQQFSIIIWTLLMDYWKIQELIHLHTIIMLSDMQVKIIIWLL